MGGPVIALAVVAHVVGWVLLLESDSRYLRAWGLGLIDGSAFILGYGIVNGASLTG